MNYSTVFDVTNTGSVNWHFVAIGLSLIVIGIALVALRSRFANWAYWPLGIRRYANRFAFVFLAGATCWTLIVFATSAGQHRSLTHAVEDRKFQIVEGRVSNFRPMPYAGHAMESFCVEGYCFEYSDYVVNGGFNNTSSHGGPIRDGVLVRISFVGNKIIKLEMAN
jgi:hypothetical protein